ARGPGAMLSWLPDSAACTLFSEQSLRGTMAAKAGAFRVSREEKTKRASSSVRLQESTAANLDRLIHERTRLAIVSALAVNTSLTFNELKDLLGATDGNLSVHARKLEDAGYTTCT